MERHIRALCRESYISTLHRASQGHRTLENLRYIYHCEDLRCASMFRLWRAAGLQATEGVDIIIHWLGAVVPLVRP